MSRLPCAIAFSGLLWCTAALAQGASADREVDVVRATFEVGNYREALKRGREAMASQNFSEAQRIELNKYAGLAAFILGDTAGAEEHLYHLLQLNPDYVLDPFAFPPPAIKFFEDLRKKNADALNLVRQKISLREEQLRREAVERERARVAAEEQRRRIEQLAAQMTVKTVEKRSLALNFVPFGAGQFQQGRNGMGVTLAVVEGALGATSIIAWAVIESMIETKRYTFNSADPDHRTVTLIQTGIPANRIPERDAWRIVKYASGAAFYTAYGYGVVDALYHHEDQVVTTTTAPVPPPTPMVKPPSPDERPRTDARPFLFPTSGGVGAGVKLTF